MRAGDRQPIMSLLAQCAKVWFFMSNHEHALLLPELAQADARAVEGMADAAVFSDAIFGFHAQQAVEKALKALLCLHNVVYPKTHDLDELVALVQQHVVAKPAALDELRVLTDFAVQYRYDFFPEADMLDRPQLTCMVAALVNEVRTLLVR
jgi:HEPN domain-containing protein